VPESVGLWWTHAAVILLTLAIVFGPRLLARVRHRASP